MGEEYTTIKLPTDLLEKIEKLIQSKKYGFRTKPEFIKEAIRQELKYYETNQQNKH
jgi:metal-responsive CopG/Arc/MetJ family transcriptional regulator